jgi:hypothetical protein
VPVAVRISAAEVVPVAAVLVAIVSLLQGKVDVAVTLTPATGNDVQCVTPPFVAVREDVPLPTALFVLDTEALNPDCAELVSKPAIRRMVTNPATVTVVHRITFRLVDIAYFLLVTGWV